MIGFRYNSGNIEFTGGEFSRYGTVCLGGKAIRKSKRITATAFTAHDFLFMKSSTRDKIKGAFKEAKGKMKEETGKATRNPDLQDRGTAEKMGGKVQRKVGDVKKVFEQ